MQTVNFLSYHRGNWFEDFNNLNKHFCRWTLNVTTEKSAYPRQSQEINGARPSTG